MNKYKNTSDNEFKSQTERRMYEILNQEFSNVKYEPETFTIVNGFNPNTLFFNRYGKLKRKCKYILDLKPCKPVTYTPDFIFHYKELKIIIEVKGMENDVFPLKRKLFRKYLSELGNPFILYFEIRTLKELKKVITFIKNHYEEIKNRVHDFSFSKDKKCVEPLNKLLDEIT